MWRASCSWASTKRRFAAGSLDFDLPSAEIVLGDDGHPVDIVEAPRTRAHRAIEERRTTGCTVLLPFE